MMILLLVLILACIALWYTVFVLFSDGARRRLKSIRRANMTKSTLPASNASPDPPVTLGWTALDDQQLTRLLKGSAP